MKAFKAILNYIKILLMGYIIHIVALELNSLSYVHRYTNCVVKVYEKKNPRFTKNNKPYCTEHMKNYTIFETITGIKFNLWKYYGKYIGRRRIYEASRKAKEVDSI